MEALLAHASDTSYSWEDDVAPFTLTLPFMPLNMGSSSGSSGDDNNVEPSNDFKTDSDSEIIQPSAATDVPLAQVGHQQVAANASCSLLGHMTSLRNVTSFFPDVGI